MALGDRLREVPVPEHCDRQARAAIGALIREHEEVLALVSDVRAARLAGDLPKQASLACQIAAVLGPHQIVEESGLFPALAADYPDPNGLLEAEHHVIETALAEAVRAAWSGAAYPANPGWPNRLTRALTLLRDHIFKEQDAIFPAALAILNAADWDAIEEIRASVVPARVPAVPESTVVVAVPRPATAQEFAAKAVTLA